jgi:hypothetical protein
MKLVIIAMYVVLRGASVSNAGPLAPTAASQTIVLYSGQTGCLGGGFLVDRSRSPQDGSMVSGFTVPPGQVLVVTGYSWNVQGGLPSRSVMSALSTSINGSSAIHVWDTGGVTDTFGNAAGGSLVPNVVVRSGTSLCVLSSVGGGPAAIVTGFLAKDK